MRAKWRRLKIKRVRSCAPSRRFLVRHRGKDLLGGGDRDVESGQDLLPFGEQVLAVVGGDDGRLSRMRRGDDRGIFGRDDASCHGDQRFGWVAELVGEGGAEAEKGGVGLRSASEDVALRLCKHVVGEYEGEPT